MELRLYDIAHNYMNTTLECDVPPIPGDIVSIGCDYFIVDHRHFAFCNSLDRKSLEFIKVDLILKSASVKKS